MNKQRRAHISKIQVALAELMGELEALRDEEQEAFDNLPDSLQESEKGQAMYDAIENIEYAFSSLEEADSYLEDAKE